MSFALTNVLAGALYDLGEGYRAPQAPPIEEAEDEPVRPLLSRAGEALLALEDGPLTARDMQAHLCDLGFSIDTSKTWQLLGGLYEAGRVCSHKEPRVDARGSMRSGVVVWTLRGDGPQTCAHARTAKRERLRRARR